MLGAFLQQAFHQLQAERNGALDQFGIIVAGVSGSPAGEGVAQLVDGDPLDPASGECEHHEKCACRDSLPGQLAIRLDRGGHFSPFSPESAATLRKPNDDMQATKLDIVSMSCFAAMRIEAFYCQIEEKNRGRACNLLILWSVCLFCGEMRER